MCRSASASWKIIETDFLFLCGQKIVFLMEKFRKLVEAGCRIRAYDPVAMSECRRIVGDSVTYCKDLYDATLDADALLLLTEWKEFRLPAWKVIKKSMRRLLVIDGRNIFDSDELEELGFEYHGIGK